MLDKIYKKVILWSRGIDQLSFIGEYDEQFLFISTSKRTYPGFN
jgi:hypothetical protein